MAETEYQPFEIDVGDLEQVEAWSGENRPLLPIGTYKFRVENVAQKTGKGKPMLAVTFVVEEGEHAGQKAWNNYMLSTAPGKARLKQLMVACGAGLSRLNSDELKDMVIYADVVHTESAGGVDEMGQTRPPKTFANVQNERPLESAEAAADPTPEPEPPPITRGANGAAGNKRQTTARRA